MSRTGQPLAKRRRPALQAWLLAALLLAAQALGLAHRVEHAPGLLASALAGPVGKAGAGEAGAVSLAAGAPAALALAPSWIDGHEAESPSCRLIDQLSHADGLSTAAAEALPALPRHEAQALPADQALSTRPLAAYHARAPPRA